MELFEGFEVRLLDLRAGDSPLEPCSSPARMFPCLVDIGQYPARTSANPVQIVS